jgi:hypothetical protein
MAVLCQWTHKTTGECFPSIATIAAHAAISVSSVKRAIVALSKKGAIKVKQRRKPDGSPDSSVYYILGFDPTPAEMEGGVGSHRTEGGFRRGRGVGSHRHHNVFTANVNYDFSQNPPELPTASEISTRPPIPAGGWRKLLDRGDQ